MPKQSTRFYRKNEAEVMKSLGLKPTINSGAGQIEKGDGQNDYIIAELKSTEKKSISVKFADIAKLEEQAIVAKKIPVFVIQDLTNHESYVMIKPDQLEDVAKYLRLGYHDKGASISSGMLESVNEEIKTRPKKVIGAPSKSDIEQFKYKRKESAAY